MILVVLLSNRVPSLNAVWAHQCSLYHLDHWPCPPPSAPSSTAWASTVTHMLVVVRRFIDLLYLLAPLANYSTAAKWTTSNLNVSVTWILKPGLNCQTAFYKWEYQIKCPDMWNSRFTITILESFETNKCPSMLPCGTPQTLDSGVDHLPVASFEWAPSAASNVWQTD